MSGTINGFNYSSEQTETTATRYTWADPTQGGNAEEYWKYVNTYYQYTLSENGTWYAGATYIVFTGSHSLTELSDNAAGTQWFYNWTTVANSSHAVDSSSAIGTVSENTIYGKDGYIYVSDTDSNNNTIASAKFLTSSGALVSKTNWSPGFTEDDNDTKGAAPLVKGPAEYQGSNEVKNETTHPANTTATTQIDLSTISSKEMKMDLVSSSSLASSKSASSTTTAAGAADTNQPSIPSMAYLSSNEHSSVHQSYYQGNHALTHTA